MDIGIYAPYGPHEATVAAIRVAEHVLHCGMRPRWLAHGAITKGVHPYWDQQVRPGGTREIYSWAMGCDRVIWFEHRPNYVRRARLVASKAPQILVFRWHDLPEGLVALSGYDQVICPSKEAKRAALDNLAVNEEQVRWCLWESGLTPLPRRTQFRPKHPSLYIPVDNFTVEYAGGRLYEVVQRLLSDYPRLEVTVEPVRKWMPGVRTHWQYLAKAFNLRLNVVEPARLPEQLARFYHHTWTFCPSLRAEFGMTVVRSLACGTPVIVHDIQPFSGMVHDGCEGLLIPCEIATDGFGAPTVAFNEEAAYSTLSQAIENLELADAMRLVDWGLERRRKVFEATWQML